MTLLNEDELSSGGLTALLAQRSSASISGSILCGLCVPLRQSNFACSAWFAVAERNFLRRRQIVFQHLGFARRWFSVRRRGHAVPYLDRLVTRAALHPRPAGFADRLHHFRFGLQLRRG